MQLSSRSDQDLLGATDALSFEEFYLRHVNTVLGYFARRTGDAELAADLASETFAASDAMVPPEWIVIAAAIVIGFALRAMTGKTAETQSEPA